MRRIVGSLALLFAACSGQQAPLGGQGAAPLAGLRAADAGTSARPVTSAGPVALDAFQPLLAEPALARAAKLVESGNLAGAAREVEAQMAKAQPAGDDVLRWQMLLAGLRERAGDLVGAAASYELCATENWALQGYAMLGVGRVQLRAGKLASAIQWLEKVPKDQPAAADARLLIAEGALRSKKPDLAIDAWRAHLTGSPPDGRDVSLRLGQALLDRAAAAPSASEPSPDVVDALRLARRVAAEAAGTPALLERARGIEKRALEALPARDRARHARPSPEDELVRVKALLDAKLEAEAERAADGLLASLERTQRWGPVGCEASLLRGKAIAAKRDTARSADAMEEVVKHCKGDDDQRARALFLAGKYAASDGRHTDAIRRWQDLEKELPKHRLADDARMNAALSWFELGVEARFTELLGSIAEEYPDGDVVLDAVFRLALRRIEKADWSGAASVLDRAAALAQTNDAARGTEYSGRERYFRARAWIETGDVDKGYAELEAIVRELPLSYYMLHAWSRLVERDPFRAKSVLDQAQDAAKHQPFSFDHQPEFDGAGFRRALELLRQGELAHARREIEALGIAKPGVAPRLLWGTALLWARAGSAKDAHEITRGLLTDWLARWPAGDWSRAWELAFPRPYRPVVQRETKKNGVPESLVYAVMREESAFDPDAVSPSDAHGLMQLIVPTAKLLARPVGLPWDAASLKQPSVNIALGARGLAELTRGFSENPLLAIPGYNAGPGRPRRWIKERPRADFDVWVELIPITETRRYTKRVLASRAAYAWLYERETAAEVMALPIRLGG